MEARVTATRFLASFNFLTPAENGLLMRYRMALSTLSFHHPHGTGCA